MSTMPSAMQAAIQASEETLQAAATMEELRWIIDQLRQTVVELQNKLFGFQEKQSATAGGPFDESTFWNQQMSPVLPRTGDVALTHQSKIPPGWLSAMGGYEVSKRDYPELYRVIGNAYGEIHQLPSSAEMFRLPNALDMPGMHDNDDLIKMLARGQFFIIRT